MILIVLKKQVFSDLFQMFCLTCTLQAYHSTQYKMAIFLLFVLLGEIMLCVDSTFVYISSDGVCMVC